MIVCSAGLLLPSSVWGSLNLINVFVLKALVTTVLTGGKGCTHLTKNRQIRTAQVGGPHQILRL